jgi:hypothetical protein
VPLAIKSGAATVIPGTRLAPPFAPEASVGESRRPTPAPDNDQERRGRLPSWQTSSPGAPPGSPLAAELDGQEQCQPASTSAARAIAMRHERERATPFALLQRIGAEDRATEAAVFRCQVSRQRFDAAIERPPGSIASHTISTGAGRCSEPNPRVANKTSRPSHHGSASSIELSTHRRKAPRHTDCPSPPDAPALGRRPLSAAPLLILWPAPTHSSFRCSTDYRCRRPASGLPRKPRRQAKLGSEAGRRPFIS